MLLEASQNVRFVKISEPTTTTARLVAYMYNVPSNVRPKSPREIIQSLVLLRAHQIFNEKT